MRTSWILLCVLGLTLASCGRSEDKEEKRESLVSYVEPRIGTAHCRWFHFTPGAVPFGMAKPAPSTNGHLGNKWGWEATVFPVCMSFRSEVLSGCHPLASC